MTESLVAREGLTKQLVFKVRSKVEKGQTCGCWAVRVGEHASDQGNKKGEGPEVGSCFLYLRNGKETETKGTLSGVEYGKILGAQTLGRTS